MMTMKHKEIEITKNLKEISFDEMIAYLRDDRFNEKIKLDIKNELLSRLSLLGVVEDWQIMTAFHYIERLKEEVSSLKDAYYELIMKRFNEVDEDECKEGE